MNTFLVVLHVMVCFVLILVVLLQRGKGSDVGAALGGGGGNTVFGSRGAGNFLTKLTTGSAIIFMVTSLSLAYMGNQAANPLLIEDEPLEATAPTDAEEATGEEVSPGALEEFEPEPSASTLEEFPTPTPSEEK
jgi:preprotein translocase subunit SecG